MNNDEKKEIIARFFNLEKTKDISKDYNVSATRIRQILKSLLNEKVISATNKLRARHLAIRRRQDFIIKYNSNPEFKEKKKKENLERYYNKKN